LEHERFDDLTRRLAKRQSRRHTLRHVGLGVGAGLLAAIGIGSRRGAAQILPCADTACRCHTGAPESCTPGLVCCADDPNRPGGSGTCVAPSACFGGLCSNDGVVCPPTCSWGSNCLDCCSGHCGKDGLCAPGSCRSAGCDCITGALSPCDEGLACCPKVEGLLGGPGLCLPRDICG
jgi:hypothetical protein